MLLIFTTQPLLIQGLKMLTNKSKYLQRYAAGPSLIAPMRLRKINDPEEMLEKYKPNDLWIQEKLDGFKVMAIKNASVKIYSRNGEDFTANVAPLVENLEKQMAKGDFWLGELVWEKDGKQDIGKIQGIFNSTPEKAKEKLKSPGKMIFYVYDFLWDGGRDITKMPYEKRYTKLKDKIKSDGIQLVKNYTWEQKEAALKNALKSGGEGIVIKPKNSTYEYKKPGTNEPIGSWAKYKPGEKAKEADVIVQSYIKGKEKLIFPAFQYKNDKLIEVGKISGLPKKEEAWVKGQIDAGKKVVLEVGYQERYEETNKLRHTSYKRIRKDKSPKEAKAFMIEYPKKMAKEIYDWVVSVYAPGKKRYPSKISKIFRIDISDTKQYQNISWLREGVLVLKENQYFTNLEVIATYKGIGEYGDKMIDYVDEVVGGGEDFDEDDMGLFSVETDDGLAYLLIFNVKQQIEYNQLDNTIKHELTHLMQAVMEVAKGAVDRKDYGDVFGRIGRGFDKEEDEFYPILTEVLNDLGKEIGDINDPDEVKRKIEEFIQKDDRVVSLKNDYPDQHKQLLKKIYQGMSKTASLKDKVVQFLKQYGYFTTPQEDLEIVRERLRKNPGKYKPFDQVSYEELKKQYWKHQLDPRYFGTTWPVWQYPKRPLTPEEQREKQRLELLRKRYWKTQLDWGEYGRNDPETHFWKYPISVKKAKAALTKNTLEDIYKLEMFLYWAKQEGEYDLEDLFKYELGDVLSRATYVAAGIFKEWLHSHKNKYGDLGSEQAKQDLKEWLEENTSEPEPEKFVASWAKTYETIKKIYEQLVSPKSNVNQAMVDFNEALMAIHNNGDMLDYLAEDVEDPSKQVNKQLLDTLSSKNNPYLGKWRKEYKRIVKNASAPAYRLFKIAGLNNRYKK